MAGSQTLGASPLGELPQVAIGYSCDKYLVESKLELMRLTPELRGHAPRRLFENSNHTCSH